MPSLTKPLSIHNANMQFTQNSVNLTNLSASLGSTNASGNLSMCELSGSAPDVCAFGRQDERNRTGADHRQARVNKRPGEEESRSVVEPDSDRRRRAGTAQPSLLQLATGNGTIQVGTIPYEQTELTNVHSNVTLIAGSSPQSSDVADLRRAGERQRHG